MPQQAANMNKSPCVDKHCWDGIVAGETYSFDLQPLFTFDHRWRTRTALARWLRRRGRDWNRGLRLTSSGQAAGSRKLPQTGLSMCDWVEVRPRLSRPKRAAETGPRRPAEAASDRDNGHGRAPENAGHLTNAFASGRSDSEAGSESWVSTVDRADRGLSPAAAGR